MVHLQLFAVKEVPIDDNFNLFNQKQVNLF